MSLSDATGPATPPEEATEGLPELIGRIRRQNGWTLQQLADRTNDGSGPQMVKQTIWNFENRPLQRQPDPATILVLAAALGVPDYLVTSACNVSCGLSPFPRAALGLIPEGFEELPIEEQLKWRDLIQMSVEKTRRARS